jgi:protein TonB
MSVETSQNSDQNLGNLGSCLVEGDAKQRARERRMRRRSLAISIAVQSAIFVAIILLPLFGRTERIALANYVPIPPYSPYHSDAHAQTPTNPRPHKPNLSPCFTCQTPIPPNRPISIDPTPDGPPEPPIISGDPTGNTTGGRSLINVFDNRPQPPRPVEEPPHKTMRVHTQLDPATLMHRVEPSFPPLARQIGRGGKVELRAIIATDGTIQSLEVFSGDPLFYQSALDAVRQWRYRPTYLNGQPVEVDTFITVIYTINR